MPTASTSQSQAFSLNACIREFVCGGFGGMCLVACGHPLDTLKVRLQTMPNPRPGEPPLYNGVVDCLRKSLKSGGILSLYKGMAPPLFGSIPMFSLAFTGYGLGKRLQQEDFETPLTYTQIGLAGAMSGIAMAPVMAPTDRIKCLLQVQDRPNAQKFNGPIDCIQHLYRTGGLRSIYRGTIPTISMEIPSSAVYFITYEFIQKNRPKDSFSIGRTLLAGGTAGVACWLVAYPFDVIKSRMQTAPDGMYKNVLDVLRATLREDGFRVFF